MSGNVSQSDRPTIKGKWVLLASALILLAVVPLATWLTLRSVERSTAEAAGPLDYAQRDSWRVLPVRYANLDASGFLQPPGDAPLRDTDFLLGEDQEARDLRFAAMSRRHAAEADPPNLEADDPLDVTGFYATYLLGHWLSEESTDEASARRAAAFAQAPGALVLRFVDEQGRSAAGLDVSPIEIRFAQVADGELDDQLVLHYPGLTTDARGRVFLPVYDGPLQVTLPTKPGLRFEAPWPDDAQAWMSWPGHVGGPAAVRVVRE